MDWTTLATRLFGADHGIRADGDFLVGSVSFDGAPIEVIGTTNHAPIGVRLALAQARVVLDTMRRHPGRPILLLIDTQGQQLRRRDELLGINRAMAHLGMCIDLARRRGHRVLGARLRPGAVRRLHHLRPDRRRLRRAAGGRDPRHALPAMARVTKLRPSLLEQMSRSNPVFAPGVANYVAMGGVRALWQGDLAAALREALAEAPTSDQRAQDGAQRGGRQLAASVVQRVLAAA